MQKWLKTILIFLNIALYFTTVALWIATPDNLVLNISTSVFTLVYSILLFFYERKRIQAVLTSRFSTRFYTEITSIFLVGCILALVNYLGFKNYKLWDVSADELNTLSEQTKLILQDVKEPTKVTLYAKRENWDQVLPILKLYSFEQSKISLDAVDVEESPHKVKSLGTSSFPAILIENPKQKVLVQVMDELSITNGFLKLTQNKVSKIYYTYGHGELDPDDTGNEGASILVTMMKNSNMQVEPYSLLKNGKIPADATALMILGPQDGFLEQEIKTLKDFLGQGGRMILSINPNFKRDSLQSFRDMLTNFGVKMNNDIVLDRLSSVHNVDASIPIVEKYDSDHPIMKNFKGTTIFPLSSSIDVLPSEDYVASVLVQSSTFPASWAEKNFAQAESGKVVFDDKIDTRGPIPLAVAVEEKGKNDLQTKIVIFASTSLVVNGYATQGPNFNLFLNAVSWITGNEGLISLNRPVLNHERVMMSSPQLGIIFYFSVVFLPLALFALSFYLYRRRLKL